ncbi:hypothetical protein DY000_02005396 [Brassica cretica]|uniref:Uncharacterized protein n=1 Tax=Brassica cretica TaxID=69181 RepID=A0ABQ7C4T1_BRACR|nr:hypothetical protein DY000_02005396 [Brassica cretica]
MLMLHAYLSSLAFGKRKYHLEGMYSTLTLKPILRAQLVKEISVVELVDDCDDQYLVRFP